MQRAALIVLFVSLTTAIAPAADNIRLPKPESKSGAPILQLLEERKSTKAYTSAPLTELQLGELLWAADGINRDKGGRTAPSALSSYPVEIYVVLTNATWLYLPEKHELAPVASGDQRKASGGQDYSRAAPLNLVYVANLEKFAKPGTKPAGQTNDLLQWAALEAGCISQNVALYCASQKLGSVIRVSVPKADFAKMAGLKDTQIVLAGQTVGHPAPVQGQTQEH